MPSLPSNFLRLSCCTSPIHGVESFFLSRSVVCSIWLYIATICRMKLDKLWPKLNIDANSISETCQSSWVATCHRFSSVVCACRHIQSCKDAVYGSYNLHGRSLALLCFEPTSDRRQWLSCCCRGSENVYTNRPSTARVIRKTRKHDNSGSY